MKAAKARHGLVPALMSDLDCFICCASSETICRYLEQGEKWHFMNTWRAWWVSQYIYMLTLTKPSKHGSSDTYFCV